MSTLTVKCNGDLVTKGENLSVDQAESNTEVNSAGLDVAKVVQQRLESLKRSGLDLLPAGTGQYAFDLSFSDASTVDVPATAVEEPKPAYAANQPNSTDSHTSELQSPTNVAPVPTAESHPEPPANVQAVEASQPAPDSEPAAGQLLTGPYGPKVSSTELDGALKVIQDEVAACTKCEELCRLRTQTVFGVGSPQTRLVFVGEGPGAEEDRKGEPFVGAAGQLLDKILGACGLSREEVYILNTIKCRPPGNRNPSQDELANCWGYAERQLEILQPEFICCLGSVAAKTVLKSTQSLGRLRKKVHEYRGSKVLVTYHPAYLLRTPSAKKHVWEDMKMLMKEMGIEIKK